MACGKWLVRADRTARNSLGPRVLQVTLTGRRRLYDAGIVLGGMNNAFNLDAVRDRLMEDQVLLEMPDSPHSQCREFPGLTARSEVRRLREFEE